MSGDHFDGSASDGEHMVTTRQMLVAPRTGDVPVPYHDLEHVEGLALGFRVQMFDLSNEDIEGSVSTGSGFGTDFIVLEWGGKHAMVRGLDLLRAWVATFDPEGAKMFPKGLS